MKNKVDCVLLVDDDEISNFISKKICANFEFSSEIKSVLNGKEALNYLINAEKDESVMRPSMIFLDINMPVMDGWEFIEAYNNLGISNKEKIKIFMLTSSSSREDEQRSQKYKEVMHLYQKPLSKEILREIEETYLAESN